MTELEILIVEDDAIVARDLREAVEEMGHGVAAVVGSAEAALRVLEAGQVGLALLDVRIPGKMDGVDLGHHLTRERKIPVVYVTAFSDDDTLRRAGASHPLNYLIKPVSGRELKGAIEIARARAGVERRLRERARMQSSVMDAIPDGLLAADARGRITLLNPAAERFLGISSDDALGRPVDRILELRDGALDRSLDDPVRRALEEGRTREIPDSAVVRRRDGSWVPVSGEAIPRGGEGGGEEGVVLTIRDVRARREAREAVRRSEEHYRTVFEESPLPVHVSTVEDGRVLDLNASFERELGHGADEARGRTIQELELWSRDEDRRELLQALGEAGRIASFRTRFRTRSGQQREVDLSVRRVRLEGSSCLLVVTRDVSERVAFEEELERQALYDTLTGLPNRTLLRDRLAHALERAHRERTGTSVLFIDLDGFKKVNDTLGHAAGDEALRLAARRIRGCFREEDTVARLGGDEFAAVLEDARRPAEAAASARRVMEALEPPLNVRGRSLELSASIGIAVLREEDVDADDMLRRSDEAMYRAKAEGGGIFRIYEAGMEEGAPGARLRPEHALRTALERGEFVLRYQPVVDLETGEVVGAEALARWEHPERGLVRPGDFLPLAEEGGLISALGQHLFRMMCRDRAAWASDPGGGDSLFVSMNLPTGQFRDPDVVDDLGHILAREGPPPSSVVVEVPEGIAFRSPTTIRGLRSLGLRVALDDVGTGLTSFSGLKELNVDFLKLHRSFVAGLGRDRADEVVVRALLGYAEGMGLGAVAEGVETEAQRERLLEMGCGLGQGYHLAEPMPPGAFVQRIG